MTDAITIIAAVRPGLANGFKNVRIITVWNGKQTVKSSIMSFAPDEYDAFVHALPGLVFVDEEKTDSTHKPIDASKYANRKPSTAPRTAQPPPASVSTALRAPLPPDLCARSIFWSEALAGKAPTINDDPQPGYYKRKMVKGGPWVGVRIWLEQEIGEDGDLLSEPRMKCMVGDDAADAGDQWLWVCTSPISAADYDYLTDTQRYATHRDPSMPEARPRESVDLNRLEPILPE